MSSEPKDPTYVFSTEKVILSGSTRDAYWATFLSGAAASVTSSIASVPSRERLVAYQCFMVTGSLSGSFSLQVDSTPQSMYDLGRAKWMPYDRLTDSSGNPVTSIPVSGSDWRVGIVLDRHGFFRSRLVFRGANVQPGNGYFNSTVTVS
jgi:hypothetical protein